MSTTQSLSSPTRTIVVGTDFSPEADRALSWAVNLAERLGQSLEIVHVQATGAFVLPPPIDVLPVAVASGDDSAAAKASLAARVERAATSGVAVSSRVVAGEPAAALNDCAKDLNAFLLVVGSHGSSGLAHVLLGSVAERVVRHAAVPVLVVPSAASERNGA